MTPDELIQKQIEEGNAPQGIDGHAYRLVFKSLKKEPITKLSPDFASRVAALASSPSKKFDWDKFFFIGGIAAFGIALIYAVFVTEFTLSFGEFKFFASYPLLFIFGIIFIVALHLLDKKLIHPTSHNG